MPFYITKSKIVYNLIHEVFNPHCWIGSEYYWFPEYTVVIFKFKLLNTCSVWLLVAQIHDLPIFQYMHSNTHILFLGSADKTNLVKCPVTVLQHADGNNKCLKAMPTYDYIIIWILMYWCDRGEKKEIDAGNAKHAWLSSGWILLPSHE